MSWGVRAKLQKWQKSNIGVFHKTEGKEPTANYAQCFLCKKNSTNRK